MQRRHGSGVASHPTLLNEYRTILLHCLIHKPYRELKNLGLGHEVAIRGRLLLTVSLQEWVCVSDMSS